MPQPALSPSTVFRACVVNAVRGGDALMAELIKATRAALAEEESNSRSGVILRNLASDSLRLLLQQEAGLLKAYPMALLEIFAEKPPEPKLPGAPEAEFDFSALALMDDDEMLAQVELSKAQQSALHVTDAVLTELNTLISAAQGLRRVQPERNPLRPENYIRALQQVVSATGASAEVRQQWMLHMRELMGKLLLAEYKKMVSSLREHGIEPVGYAVLSTPSGARNTGDGQGSSYGGGYGGGGHSGSYGGGYGDGHSGYSGHGSGYAGFSASSQAPMGGGGGGGMPAYGRGMVAHSGWNAGQAQAGAAGMLAMAPEAEEALLTVGILRQMLAGGDPFDVRPQALVQATTLSPGLAGLTGVPMGQGGPFLAHQMTAMPQHPAAHRAAEAMADMAQLEHLVGRLAGQGQGPVMGGTLVAGVAGSPLGQILVPMPGWTGPVGLAGTAPGMLVAAEPPVDQSIAMALDVVSRMVDNISQDARLLPPVQQAVRTLEPAIKQLVQCDPAFFSDEQHPARRLLDELTQRSMSFASEIDSGFSGFMRLATQAVDHLATTDITDASPFDTVLKALRAAWERQDKRIRLKQEADQRAQLETQIAADIRSLPDLDGVPSDILEFAAGPWAYVIAQTRTQLALSTEEDDPEGYWALVPTLLWCSQPSRASADPDQLNELMPRMVAKLRKGLKAIDYPSLQTSALLQRLVGLHQQAFDRSSLAALVREDAANLTAANTAADEEVPERASESGDLAPELAAVTAAAAVVDSPVDPHANFVIGCWVELLTNGRLVLTRLTWTSPQGTLFLFTGADASTQSMTRRMRDKLLEEGALRVVPAPVASRSGKGGGAALAGRSRSFGGKSS